MTVRISWDRYEVALLFDTYERVAGGSDINSEAVKLSESLRTLATRKGISIDETYRNVNGMKMQLANVQYLFTRGQKGLSGASTAIRQMYELYRTDYTEYQMILKEAIRFTGSNASIEDAFFAYTKKRMRLSPDMIADYLQKAAAYCHLKQPLLGMADVKAVRNVQQKVAEGKLLRFQYGKDAQAIRSVTQLYYAFIKSYRTPQEEPPVQKISAEEQTKAALDVASDVRISDTGGDSEHQTAISMKISDDNLSESKGVVPSKDITKGLVNERRWVEFDKDSSYLFTKPVSYTYRDILHNTKSWNRLYVEVCGLLFADYREAFMNIMNGDVPGRSALAFADEQNYRRMRVPKSFAPGYYLESNLDATTIVRRIRGLSQLFNLGDELRIAYIKFGDTSSPELPERTCGSELNNASPWSEYEAVLKQAFPKGFQKESVLDIKKLRKRWTETYEKELKDSDNVIRLQLAEHCVDTGKRWYLAELLLSDEERLTVLQYIDHVLSSGKTVLYYSSIYAALEHRLESTVLTEDLLVSYLLATCQNRYILRNH